MCLLCCGEHNPPTPVPSFKCWQDCATTKGIWTSWDLLIFITPSVSDQQGLQHARPWCNHHVTTTWYLVCPFLVLCWYIFFPPSPRSTHSSLCLDCQAYLVHHTISDLFSCPFPPLHFCLIGLHTNRSMFGVNRIRCCPLARLKRQSKECHSQIYQLQKVQVTRSRDTGCRAV